MSSLHSRGKEFLSAYVLPKRRIVDWAAIAILMAAAVAVFFINLTASGYANEFYSAAAQAGSKSWWAMLWGSSDSGNAITVDKPPMSIWFMALSVRIFGLSSFAILLPEALMGVATTYLIYALVRRYWGNWAGIIAGALFITTPVVALIFRFNNPDALLVLLMTGAVYSSMRAMEYAVSKRGNRRRTWWMVLAGVLVGFGFLTKQFQVMLVVPPIAVVFLIASPTKFLRRLFDGVAAVISMIVAAGWWVALTVLVPASMRPYIGGSQTNSFIELTLSYNGLGRLTGSETGSVTPGGSSSSSSSAGSQSGMWGETGWNRLFTSDFAGQISWLAPFAFAGIVLAIIVVGKAARTDLKRALALMAGLWLIITWGIFSFMSGIFHAYYTVALAPALAILAALAVISLWSQRNKVWSPIVAALLVIGTSVWSFYIIRSASVSSLTWLSWAVLGTGIVAAALLVLTVAYDSEYCPKALSAIALILATFATMAGPVTWTAYTVAQGHNGSIVYAGPNSNGASSGGPGGGASNGGGAGGPGGNTNGGAGSNSSTPPSLPNGNSNSETSTAPGQSGESTSGTGGSSIIGGAGSSSVSFKLIKMLKKNASKYRWVAATSTSQNAATYQLASEEAVMAIGGFNGTDPAPTLAQFKKYVKQGLIHYYIASGNTGGTSNGGSTASSKIAAWVAKHYKSTTVDGVTVYDLTQKAS